MSRSRLILHGRHPIPTPRPLTLHTNFGFPNWWMYATVFKNTAFSAPGNISKEYGGFVGRTSGNPVPDANRDASGYVKSVPGGEAAVSLVGQFPTSLAPRRLKWVSALGGANHGCATMAMRQGGTGVTVDLVAQTVTYTPVATADGSSGVVPVFDFTPVSGTDYPKFYDPADPTVGDRPVTDDGALLMPEFTSLVAAACSPNPIIRLMDWSRVNDHNNPIHQTATAGVAISSITFVGTLATVTTSTAHGLLGIGTNSQSASVTVSGATPVTYNVTDAYVKVISPTQFQYTMGGTPAGNASVVGSYTVGDAAFQSTNLHYPVTANEPGTQFLEPVYTAAIRNKNGADAEWHDGVMLELRTALCAALGGQFWYNAPVVADSTFYPAAAAVSATFSTANNRDTYLEFGNEISWNPGFPGFHQLRNEARLRGTLGDALASCRLLTDSNVGLSGLAAIDGFTPIAGDRILVTGQTTASQNGVYVAAAGAWSRAADTLAYRAIWQVTSGLNYAQTSWFIQTQGAIVTGTTPLTITLIWVQHRYAERLIEVANAFIPAFAAIPTRLKIVAAGQNYGGTTAWDDMAAFVGPADWAKVTHLSVAPYYGDNGEAVLTAAGIGVGYTGSTATLKTAMLADVDDTITHLVTHINYAAAHGKTLIPYEGANTLNLSDNTYRNAWARSADAYDVELYFLSQLELRAAPLQAGGFAMLQYMLSYPLGGDKFSWGLVENIMQTRNKATTPKLQAHTDFLNGIRA